MDDMIMYFKHKTNSLNGFICQMVVISPPETCPEKPVKLLKNQRNPQFSSKSVLLEMGATHTCLSTPVLRRTLWD